MDRGLKLTLVLRFLETGNSSSSLAFELNVGNFTVTKTFEGVSQAIIDEYQPEWLGCPDNIEG